jgi:hypothetical protein
MHDDFAIVHYLSLKSVLVGTPKHPSNVRQARAL